MSTPPEQKDLSHSLRWTQQLMACLEQPALSPPLMANGKVAMPGLHQGLTIPEYRRLATLYQNILEADTLLMSYRQELGLLPIEACNDGLTRLDASRHTAGLFYKREDQTAIKAYKVRGAVNGMSYAMETLGYFRFLAVSTGNHALGVLKAAELLRPESVRIFVPTNTAPAKLARLMQESQQLHQSGVQTQIIISGGTFDEAKRMAMAENQAEHFIDPYGDPQVVAGQGSVGLELFRQILPLLSGGNVQQLTLISPIGGGGLLSGTATALRMATLWHPAFQHLQLRLVGLRLEDIHSALGDAIRVKYIDDNNRTIMRLLGVEVHTMTDADMRQGMDWVWHDVGSAVEGACGGTLLPVFNHSITPAPDHLVVCMLSGGNVAPTVN
jgi:threonine dehydratase